MGNYLRYIIAACILVLLSITGYIYYQQNGDVDAEAPAHSAVSHEAGSEEQSTESADLTTETNTSSAMDDKKEELILKLREEADKYFNEIVNGADSLYNNLMASLSLKAYLGAAPEEPGRDEYRENLGLVQKNLWTSNVYSGVSKNGVKFIALIEPLPNHLEFVNFMNEIRGDENEYNLFIELVSPLGMRDRLYYAVDVYAEDLMGAEEEFIIGIVDQKSGMNNRPLADPVKEDGESGNINKAMIKFNRELKPADQPIHNREWKLFMFKVLAAEPELVIEYQGESIALRR